MSHQKTVAGKPVLGFSFALLATMTWGTLPIAARQVLATVSAPTLVWARFTVAAAVLAVLLGMGGKLPDRRFFSWKTVRLLALGVIGISANFLLIAEGLHHISPTTTQVLWQVAPFTMILAGVLVFKEKMTAAQKVGLGVLMLGLVLFFNDKFGELFRLGSYAAGVLLSALGSMSWVCYAIAQKLLSAQFAPQQILMLIYAAAALAFVPFAEPVQIGNIDHAFVWLCFVYCCLNTLIGYGSYGESLKHWEASKVSVVTTLIPVFTMIFSHIGHIAAPHLFDAPDMNTVGYIGAFVVVGGAVTAAVGDKWLKH